MKILLINVSLRPKSPVKMFPVGLGYIATAMKNAGFTFDLLDVDLYRYSDEYLQNYFKNNYYDIVCMGCIVTGYKIVKEYASMIKRAHPQTKIVVGNSVATSIYQTLLNKTAVDYAVIGEGDVTIVELLQALSIGKTVDQVSGICFLRDGKIAMTPARPIITDISSIALLDFDIFDIKKYIDFSQAYVPDPLPIPREKVRALPVNTARGCVAKCGFCYHVFREYPYRYRSADSIVGEIKLLIEKYGLNYIFFWDELTFFSKKHTLNLVNKIIDENLKFYWMGNCRANLFDRDEDVEILLKMKSAGCIALSYSLESADEGILLSMNKKIKVEHFVRQTMLLHKAGLSPKTSIVIGYPQETAETIKKTFDCCIENRIYPTVGYLLPQPSSPVYDYAWKHGFIRDEEEYLLLMGDRQDLRLNMTSMSNEQLQACVLEELKRCNEVLKVGLQTDSLIKTKYYRATKI